MPIGWDGLTPQNVLPSLGNAMLSAFGTVANAPRQALWDVGPTMVGRSGQGPQTGTDLLSRLGMDPNSGLTHALGFGAEVAGDPLTMMSALSMAPRAAAGAAGPSAQRVGQFAGGGLDDAMRAASQRATQQIPTQPGSAVARQMQGMAFDRPPLVGAPSPMVSPQIGGRLDRAVGPGLEYGMGRANAAHAAADMPNFATPLLSEQFLNPAQAGAQQQGRGLLDRLQRIAPRASGPQIDY